MAAKLTASKFRAPSPRATALVRDRLIATMDSGADARLTLVSAPAGFGKSTMLAQWIAHTAGERDVAWLSIDDRDNDPTVFWTYVAASVSGASGQRPDAADSPAAHSPEAVLETLATLDRPLALVLDDYHLITATAIQEHVADLIRDAPPRVQVVISTRVDPRLPLARLRAQHELVEVRAAHLRFGEGETAKYLTESMGLQLDSESVRSLETRTEGWIAALQLAALSLRDRSDTSQFIAAFAGDDRHVVDYLTEEVLERLAPSTRQFLMDTCVADRLSAPLANALTGAKDAATTLEDLDRGNLFVVPLDDRREWYRYHHLFGDMLRGRLRNADPARLLDQHRKASEWWQATGDLPLAIGHSLAAGDSARATQLVQEWAPAASRERQEATLRRLIEALPWDEVAKYPQLALTYVGVLMQSGEFNGVERLLDDVEPAIAAMTDAEPNAAHVKAMLAAYRAAVAQRGGDMVRAAAFALDAFELTDPQDHLGRGATAGLSGLILWGNGELSLAEHAWHESLASLERAGHVADVMGGSIALADILVAQGRPHDARAVFETRLATTTRQPSVLRGTADMHTGLANLAWRSGDLEAARRHLEDAQALGETGELAQNPYRSLAVSAHVLWSTGQLEEAAAELAEADRVYDGDMFPNVRPVAAMRARLDLARGRTRDAVGRASTWGLSFDDEPAYRNEYAHLSLAITSLADAARSGDRTAPAAVVTFVERLRDAAVARGGLGSLPEIDLVLANAHLSANEPTHALAALNEAVAAAAPQHSVGPFSIAGSWLSPLLAKLEDTPFVREVTAACSQPTATRSSSTASGTDLSSRERDVLRLLRSDLDGPQIARELFVSVNTLRTHTKSIFSKLGVTNRRAAVRVAEQRGLFD